VAALSPALGSIFDLGVCVTLVGVPEPSCPLLLAADQSDPFVATTAKSFPDIRVAIHSTRLLGLLERVPRRRADSVGKALVIPESRVLQHQPATGLADATPTLTLVAMATNPFGRVQVAIKSELLLMGNKILVAGIHILGRGRYLLLVKRSIQVRGI
jgi:hypothetical protein